MNLNLKQVIQSPDLAIMAVIYAIIWKKRVLLGKLVGRNGNYQEELHTVATSSSCKFSPVK